MNELIDTIHAILTAETGVGELLNGLNILRNENEGLLNPAAVIRRDREETIEQTNRYKAVTGHVRITVLSVIEKVNGDTSNWRTAESTAETWARKIEKIIMRNPNLTTVTYTNGFTAWEQETQVESKQYGFGVEQGSWWAYAELALRVNYIYRDGDIAVS